MSNGYDRTSLPEAEAAGDSPAGLGNLLAIAVLALSVRSLLQYQLRLANERGFFHPTLVWSCILLAVTGPLGILVHECGHYLAGMAAGQYCRAMVIGPLELGRGGRGWRVRWIPLRRAGMVDLVPSTFAHFRLRRAVCVAGGPVASLLSGLIFTALSWQARRAFVFWILSFSAQMGLVGVLGLLPLERYGARSDGYLLWQLLRGGLGVDELQRGLLVASSQATGLRLRDWPHDVVVRLAESPPEGASGRYCDYLAYVHLLDRGEPQAAGESLGRLMEKWRPGDPPEYALEAAYFLAFHGNRLEEAQRWLALETRDAEPWVRLRARAAVERAAGAHGRCRELVDEALARLRAAPSCGAYRYEADRLSELDRGAR